MKHGIPPYHSRVKVVAMFNIPTLKIAMFIWAILSLIALNAQNTFQIDKSYLDSTSFDKYKTFIVSENFDIDFIGRQIPAHRRFTIDAAQLNLIEQAIKTEYYTARVKQIDSQWAQMETYKESYDWDLAMKQRTKQRPKMLKAFKKEQKSDLGNYDRYLFGYSNELNEQIVLIRFDPHKIKYFTIADEQHISNLPIMTYNLNTKILSLSGWE